MVQNVDAASLKKSSFRVFAPGAIVWENRDGEKLFRGMLRWHAAGCPAGCGRRCRDECGLAKNSIIGEGVSKNIFFRDFGKWSGDVPGHVADSIFEFRPIRRAQIGVRGSERRGHLTAAARIGDRLRWRAAGQGPRSFADSGKRAQSTQTRRCSPMARGAVGPEQSLR